MTSPAPSSATARTSRFCSHRGARRTASSPRPLDAVTISESDVFLYNGGEGEYWVDSMLGAAGENIAVIARMMDYVDALDEEYVEGHAGLRTAMTTTTSMAATMTMMTMTTIMKKMSTTATRSNTTSTSGRRRKTPLSSAAPSATRSARPNPANEDFYRANCDDYCAQIEALDARFADLCASTPHKLLVFADRFPMLYFCREFGLDYRAAFHGCSGDTEPSLATIKYLIDKVEDEDIPVVYTIDFGTKKIAAVVSECTGAAVDTLYSMQTVSRADFDAGETYLTLMERNYEALRKGLNE